MGDYCSLSNLKRYLGITDVKDDGILEDAIGAAEQVIDTETKRTFRIVGDTWRRFHAIDDVQGDTLLLDCDLVKDTEIINGDGNIIPVASRSLLTVNQPPYWGIKLKSDYYWTFWTDPIEAIRVRGWWGYSIKAPPDIVQATRYLAAYLYRQKDAQAFETVSFIGGGVLAIPDGMPKEVNMILDRYRRVGVR